MSLAGAITNLQAKAKALSSVSIKSAPPGPIDSTVPLPASFTYLASGSAVFVSGSQTRIDVVLKTELWLPRSPVDTAFDQMTAAAFEFIKDVAADPTLGGNATNVIAPTFEVLQSRNLNGQEIIVLSFSWPVKSVEVPG